MVWANDIVKQNRFSYSISTDNKGGAGGDEGVGVGVGGVGGDGGIYESDKLEIWVHHTMDLPWEKFQWILPLYMKPISFQSKASVVCPFTAVIFIDYCLKKLNVFSQHIGKQQMNIWIPQNKSPGIEMLINFLC